MIWILLSFLDTPLLIYGKGLLKDHTVHITGIGISSKTEVSKAVYDIFSFICFIYPGEHEDDDHRPDQLLRR